MLEAQGLVSHDRTDTLSEIRRLECVQIDPVAAIERNQHLVLVARLANYRPAALDTLLTEGKIFEFVAHAACVMPIEDYPMFAGARRAHVERAAPHLAKLGSVPDEIRAILAERGPTPARAFESAHRVRGWWDTTGPKTKATSHALNLMLYAGEIMVVRREGTTRYFDLARHAVAPAVYDESERMSTAEADAQLFAKYCRGMRVFDRGDPHFGWRRPMPVAARRALLNGDDLVTLTIKDVKRPYWMLASEVESLEAARRRPASDRARFLPPLDNFLWHRRRLVDLFGFDYTWEVYTPAARRKYGYYTMPILVGDQLVGRLDPLLDREQGVLVVRLYLEPGVRVTKRLSAVLRQSLSRFARWHGADDVRIERTVPRALKLALNSAG